MTTSRTAAHGAAGDPIFGRERELTRLEGLVDGLPERGAALLVRGEPGIGKSTVMGYARQRGEAAGVRILHTNGVQSEAELSLAGLHQLMMPILEHAAHLPPLQRTALLAAFGMARPKAAPDRFMIALAVLELLSDVAERSSLLIVAEDTQWLDRPSADVLSFVAWRVEHASIVMLLALIVVILVVLAVSETATRIGPPTAAASMTGTLAHRPVLRRLLRFLQVVADYPSATATPTALGLPAGALAETVAGVNRMAGGEEPDPFGRDTFVDGLSEPLFYGIGVCGALFHTQGGLKVDAHARVLRPDSSPIPGLYAGGGTAAGISGHGAEGYLAGNGLLAALGLGKMGSEYYFHEKALSVKGRRGGHRQPLYSSGSSCWLPCRRASIRNPFDSDFVSRLHDEVLPRAGAAISNAVSLVGAAK